MVAAWRILVEDAPGIEMRQFAPANAGNRGLDRHWPFGQKTIAILSKRSDRAMFWSWPRHPAPPWASYLAFCSWIFRSRTALANTSNARFFCVHFVEKGPGPFFRRGQQGADRRGGRFVRHPAWGAVRLPSAFEGSAAQMADCVCPTGRPAGAFVDGRPRSFAAAAAPALSICRRGLPHSWQPVRIGASAGFTDRRPGVRPCVERTLFPRKDAG